MIPVPRRLAALIVLTAAVGAAAPSQAGDVTVFVARSRPTEAWGDGYGAALSSTWFKFATFEAEVARLPGEAPESGMTSFTGSAFLSVPISFLTPYGGFGFGIFRQTERDRLTDREDSDTGTLKAFVLGLKMHLGELIVLRGDYRRLTLSGDPPIGIDDRFAAGIGLKF
jgi:hypothetical protein